MGINAINLTACTESKVYLVAMLIKLNYCIYSNHNTFVCIRLKAQVRIGLLITVAINAHQAMKLFIVKVYAGLIGPFMIWYICHILTTVF